MDRRVKRQTAAIGFGLGHPKATAIVQGARRLRATGRTTQTAQTTFRVRNGVAVAQNP